MKNYLFSLLFIGFLFNSIDATAQTNNTVSEKKALEKPYNPNDNAQQKIDALLKKAKKEKKNVKRINR